jgi:hypothetical protein
VSENGNETKSRPLRIVLKNKADRGQILQKATKLADAPDNYKKISINADYSKEEREIVRKKVDEAKQLSEEDLNYVYKVRGPPWDLRMKKFPKKEQA